MAKRKITLTSLVARHREDIMKNNLFLHRTCQDVTTIKQQLAKEEAKRYAEQSQQERTAQDYHLLIIENPRERQA